MTGLGWARLIEVGLSHVDHLADSAEQEQWMVLSPDGSALVRITRFEASWSVYVYRPGPRPAGGTSTMRDWVFDWQRVYRDAGELVDDVAAIAG